MKVRKYSITMNVLECRTDKVKGKYKTTMNVLECRADKMKASIPLTHPYDNKQLFHVLEFYSYAL